MTANSLDRLILTDCDGVLMNWEYSFIQWMERKHFLKPKAEGLYDMAERFGLTRAAAAGFVEEFNGSAWMKHLPPMRDAISVVRNLHEKHGYVFRMITSMSNDPHAQQLRIENTHNLFGTTAFEGFDFAGCGECKKHLLEPYRDSGLTWIEDMTKNAVMGLDMGLDAHLIAHPWNLAAPQCIPQHASWKSLYEYLT